ncbi:hypothetical protein IE81DRAFT_193501 [Ceraceosorus guamensis]|uniref:Uncharacterized protein n=1 Tax=Ceraceosorus guamensis TaxID=1522189 RepID=A0A316W9V7_9BASI|nr:hypothetical protein IE81DRAFT_193501 [Ceraceosorus guamensis]PWN45511.1 hypothetical protein IE81DRAFT_193501 [Ceraceosorus guamensis]
MLPPFALRTTHRSPNGGPAHGTPTPKTKSTLTHRLAPRLQNAELPQRQDAYKSAGGPQRYKATAASPGTASLSTRLVQAVPPAARTQQAVRNSTPKGPHIYRHRQHLNAKDRTAVENGGKTSISLAQEEEDRMHDSSSEMDETEDTASMPNTPSTSSRMVEARAMRKKLHDELLMDLARPLEDLNELGAVPEADNIYGEMKTVTRQMAQLSIDLMTNADSISSCAKAASNEVGQMAANFKSGAGSRLDSLNSKLEELAGLYEARRKRREVWHNETRKLIEEHKARVAKLKRKFADEQKLCLDQLDNSPQDHQAQQNLRQAIAVMLQAM